MHKILLFNPRSATYKFRVPNSILQIAASIDGIAEWVIVDGNRERDPYEKIRALLETGEFRYVGFTVMPGPRLKQAIPYARRIREEFPGTVMIWGDILLPTSTRSCSIRAVWILSSTVPATRLFPR
ncbi:hypothetical protein ACQ86N_32855 [Puia sp. P3]|uniref:hypothetical protein n=1 Tax=Puia sp. P3 TaxID=3423952 RepID=UPI003D671257